MRPLTFVGQSKAESFERYVHRCLRQISDASMEDAMEISDGFLVTNFTVTRTLNAGTATTANIANFLATFVNDLKTRGPNRTQ